MIPASPQTQSIISGHFMTEQKSKYYSEDGGNPFLIIKSI